MANVTDGFQNSHWKFTYRVKKGEVVWLYVELVW